jgi:hypothetical protein
VIYLTKETARENQIIIINIKEISKKAEEIFLKIYEEWRNNLEWL